MQPTVTHCNPLQPTATHCNTLQHTATHRTSKHGQRRVHPLPPFQNSAPGLISEKSALWPFNQVLIEWAQVTLAVSWLWRISTTSSNLNPTSPHSRVSIQSPIGCGCTNSQKSALPPPHIVNVVIIWISRILTMTDPTIAKSHSVSACGYTHSHEISCIATLHKKTQNFKRFKKSRSGHVSSLLVLSTNNFVGYIIFLRYFQKSSCEFTVSLIPL